MQLKSLLVVSAVVVLVGCAAPQAIQTTTSFDPAHANSMLVAGPNSVRGSALIRQRAGGVVTCAGREVWLIPSTAYAEERFNAIYGNVDRGYTPAFGGKRVAGEEPQYRELMRKTICDAQGYFKFENVADGSFYLVSAITWQVSAYVPEGGAVMQKVTLKGGENKEIVLSP